MTVKDKILQGRTYLGIELGSTRIKAVLIDDSFSVIASGSKQWENRFENGCWTYSLDDIHGGIQACYKDLAENVKAQYGIYPETYGAMGISAMMHGYMAFDKNDKFLVPFRTWRNTMTAQAAGELTKLLGFNIPQRWSIAHLYQAVLNKEAHVPYIAYINTLAGYVHKRLTDRFEVGVGEASGIFPVEGIGYKKEYLEPTEKSLAEKGFDHKLKDILPAVRNAGEKGAVLTEEGAKFLDPEGRLKAGVPVCPPEGDAGTGMVATDSVLKKTGNISAGTSIFAMLVLEKPLNGVYEEIDVVTTGTPFTNSLTDAYIMQLYLQSGELALAGLQSFDAWVNMFGEFAKLTGNEIDKSRLYETLYKNAMTADSSCGGVTAYNCLSGEPVIKLDEGRPMYFRTPNSTLTLGSFFRAQLYSSFTALKIGMDILFDKEQVKAEKITGHGGLFKVSGVASQLMADALSTPVSVMKTAGEGGAWGMAVLADYLWHADQPLDEFLDARVFADAASTTENPDENDVAGFEEFFDRFRKGLPIEHVAIESIPLETK